MPRYTFVCEGCGERSERVMTFAEHDEWRESDHLHSIICLGMWEQVLDFRYGRPMPEHYSPALGRPVSSSRDFHDGLKRQSEAASVRTGIEHNYMTVDPTDPSSAGVNDAGMEATNRRVHNELMDGHRKTFS